MGRGSILRVIYFYHLADDREGKSYGGPHLGGHGIVPGTVDVFGVAHIQGNVEPNFIMVAMSINDNISRPGMPKDTQKNLQECIQANLQTSS